MSFSWRTTPSLEPATAAALGVDGSFPDQAAAEAWFTEHWPELEDAGVDAVTLLDGADVVYGPMPLSA